ncbi:MAG: flagellar export chaperone FliS [Gemmatimonadetes bacterium]|nr:flagellar export chaperone FliS [Gemmatimonadota bacterium]
MKQDRYRKQYNQVQIQTANKGKLIVMLYQGALKFMKKALQDMDKKDMEQKGNALIKAQDIILELLYALDQEKLNSGNELALNLQRLYLYAYRRLVHANLRQDEEAIKEIISIMTNLVEAWETVVASDGSMVTTPSSQSGLTITG